VCASLLPFDRAIPEIISPPSSPFSLLSHTLSAAYFAIHRDLKQQMEKERPCTFLIHNDTLDTPVTQLKEQLENGDVETKISALKKTILLMLNGQSMSQLLMSIIRFCMPHTDKTIKKLLLLYWELCEKTGPDGKLLHEMILLWCVLFIRCRSPPPQIVL